MTHGNLLARVAYCARKFSLRSVVVYGELTATNELEDAGIVTVPFGSLESWASEIDDKARFAERAPEIILADPKLKQRLEGFLSKLLKAVGCPKPVHQISSISIDTQQSARANEKQL